MSHLGLSPLVSGLLQDASRPGPSLCAGNYYSQAAFWMTTRYPSKSANVLPFASQ